MGGKPASLEQRLLRNKTGGADECWLWRSAVMANGYGIITVEGRARLAHRMSYQEFCGPIPDGHDVCHKCDVRNCINPAHLFTGTRKENMEDCSRKGRLGPRDTCGERNGRAKLTRGEVEEMRRLLLFTPGNGRMRRKRGTIKSVAEKFNVTPAMVGKIVRGEAWA